MLNTHTVQLTMAALTLNSLKHVMRAMVDSPGFDRVLSKVNMDSLRQLVFDFKPYFCDCERREKPDRVCIVALI